MDFIRTHILTKIFTLITAIGFLNMNFFLTEVRMLNLHLDQEMIENIAQLILNVGMEEERDIFEDIPDEEGKKSIDYYLFAGRAACSGYYFISERKKASQENDSHPPGCPDIATPPPKG